jgi:hypothetical protein
VLADYPIKGRPFIVGHPDCKFTQLPARDATPQGKIKWSNRFPNDSFFTNWTRLEDRIVWNVEVAADGVFQADLYYTCPEEDIGATVELSFNGSKVRGKVVEAHDPPLRGMENDRVKRIESYVKDFRPLELGAIPLDRGRGDLVLRALDIPGRQVMDFRLLVLTRLDRD